mgnify:FL=1
MKKTLLLSVSLGVLGFASPLVHEQIVGAETSQTATQEFPDKITIHQQFQVRNIRGDKSVLDKQATVKMYIDKSKSSTFSAPDNVPHYHPVVSEVHYSSGMVVNYMAEDAVVTIKYLDENNQPIQDNKVFNQATIFGTYRLNKNEFDVSGYELLNSKDINGKIKETNWDVTLKYKSLNPLIAADKLANVVVPDQPEPGNSKSGETGQTSEPIQLVSEKPMSESASRPVVSTTATTDMQPSPSTPSEAGNRVVPSVTQTEPVHQPDVKPAETPDKEVKDATTSKSGPKHDDKKVKVVGATGAENGQLNSPVAAPGTKLPDPEPKTQPATKTNGASSSSDKETGATKPESKKEGAVADSSTNAKSTSSVQSETGKKSRSSKPVETTAESLNPDEKVQEISKTSAKPSEKPADLPGKTTDQSGSTKNTVKTSESDSKDSEKPVVQTKPKIPEINQTKVPEKSTDHQEKQPMTTTYQLHGIDTHGHLLFNKALHLTSEEARAFRSKNVEFYGYELQSTDLDASSKTLTLHYTAKKVTFNIINVDQDGKTISKDSVELEYGQTKTYTAKFISGYRVQQPTQELKADNLMPEDVQFTYIKLADKSNKPLAEPTALSSKTGHKKGRQSAISGRNPSETKAKRHNEAKDASDVSEKLPQTGESQSVVGVLSGVVLLGALIGKKLFKRLI